MQYRVHIDNNNYIYCIDGGVPMPRDIENYVRTRDVKVDSRHSVYASVFII